MKAQGARISTPVTPLDAARVSLNQHLVGRAVEEICTEAHRLELRAEELVIGIKQAWAQLAPVRARHLGDRDGDVLGEVVSTSIDVFFAAREGR